MVTRANIISILKSKNISYKEKEKIVNKKYKLLTKVLENTSLIELIKYLFDNKIPKSVKYIISQIINNRNLTHDELAEIEKYLHKQNVFKESYLLKDIYPKIIKKNIINILYKGNIIEILNSDKKTLELKKRIIDIAVDKKMISTVLCSINNENLINYILDTKFNNIDNIIAFLSGKKTKFIEIIIERYINETNILKILSYPLSEDTKDEIIKQKYNELTNEIDLLSTNEIINIITSNETYPSKVYDIIINNQKGKIIQAIKMMSFTTFRKTLCKVKDNRIVNIFITNHPLKVKLSLLFTKKISLLSWLYNDSIPYEIKDFIIKNKQNELKSSIKFRTIGNLKLCYLRKTNNIPEEIRKLIIELKQDELITDIKQKPKYVIINEILYGNYCDIYKKLIITTAINEDILRELILRGDEELITLLLDTCQSLVINILNNMTIPEIMTLSYFENDSTREQIVYKYKDEILKILSKIESEELFSYLEAYSTNHNIKVLILKLKNIPDIDFNNVIELIKFNETQKVLENYNLIKNFIEGANISFDSFVEYGSGSETYNDWFDKVLNIISHNNTKSFYRALHYLMNELYLEDRNKENMVYTIINFLEIIDNFNECYNLIMNLTDNDVLLDKESRANLKYLFESSYKSKNEITTLDDLQTARIKICKQYENTINTSNSLEELKMLFNKLILSNSFKTAQYIGGIETLQSLKKYNKDNKNFLLLVDNLIKCVNVIEKIQNCVDIEVVRKILKYFVVDNPDKLITLETTFIKFKKDIRKIFELDAKLNLSKISNAKNLGLINEDLSKKYGGEVYDFRNVNYCLYAHVLSRYEKMDMLVNGIANGNRNFMSVSPISYLGQKYYFDRTSTTLAIDTIPAGSFICGSLSNMSTNYNITRNSVEVKETLRKERGILETSAVTEINSEVLLYREGIKVCGIILPDGREPSSEELEYHEKYNLPFIITQKVMTSIDKAQEVFKLNDIDIDAKAMPKELEEILDKLAESLPINKENNIYTGREIALITDAHALYEPTLAVLEDIRKNGIKEIYSLGDNIGEGPNPHEIMELLEEYNVISLAGNSEYYNILGIEPFSYFDKERCENQDWTYNKLSSSDINLLKLYKPSCDLVVGDQKIGLCHFANDIRWDYLGNNSTWAYHQNFRKGITSKQFLYTNSAEAQAEIAKVMSKKNSHDKKIGGYLDAMNNPLFEGKKVTDYDAILQGHVHFHLDDYVSNTKISTLRAVGMGYVRRDYKNACYYVIKEKKDGTFDIEKRLVDFNRNLMLGNIISSDIPHKEKILKYVRA